MEFIVDFILHIDQHMVEIPRMDLCHFIPDYFLRDGISSNALPAGRFVAVRGRRHCSTTGHAARRAYTHLDCIRRRSSR